MRASSVAVRTVPSQTCFVRLPPVLIRQLPPTTTACAFRLRWPAEAPNRTVYVSWGGEVMRGDRIVNSVYEIKMNVEPTCEDLCKMAYTAAEMRQFSGKIAED